MSKRTGAERRRGAEVKRIRAKLGWTWKALAAFLGVSESTVARWESGRTRMSQATALLLAREITARKGLAVRKGKGR